VRLVRSRGLVRHRTVVLGACNVGAELAETLQQHPAYGLRPVGFLDSRPLLPAEALPVPVLGGNGALAETGVRYGIEVAVIAFGSQRRTSSSRSSAPATGSTARSSSSRGCSSCTPSAPT
jgi:FlaA1/EpsC-like NDP-sugar epimerase